MRGMGATCNWTDEFGQCITPGPSDVVELSGSAYQRLLSGSGSDLTTWLNANVKTVGLAAAAVFGFVLISRMR